MKKYKILILALLFCFSSASFAQNPTQVSVCLQGGGTAEDTQLRIFAVTVSGASGISGGYLQLASGDSKQSVSYTVTSPNNIKIQEPSNSAFSCARNLNADVRSIHVIISYPPDRLPYCVIKASSSPQPRC